MIGIGGRRRFTGQIAPQVEHLPMNELSGAIERLRRGDVIYRFVLDGPV